MSTEIVSEALSSCGEIHNIRPSANTCFMEKDYEYVVNCDLSVLNDTVPIIICIPADWDRRLIDIYIKEKESFPFIPHIDRSGKVCLFELEGLLIDYNLTGIILQSIHQAIEIISAGLLRTNEEDFVSEFDLYWNQLPNARVAKLNLVDNSKIQKIKYAIQGGSNQKNETTIQGLLKSRNSKTYISSDSRYLNKFGPNNATIRNAVFIHLNSTELILPPDIRHGITSDYVEKLLNYTISKELLVLLSKIGKDKLIVIKIHQPNGMVSLFGVFLCNCVLKIEREECAIVSTGDIYPMAIKRVDKEYLSARSDALNAEIKSKRVLLIGCGSLGGYIANELAKAGIENVTLVDDDIFLEDNVFRHLLGMESVGEYKCVALQTCLEKNIPELKVTSFPEKIEHAIQEEILNLNDYCIIISAIGDHNVNRWLNRYVRANEIAVPIIYAWNEVMGIGSHVAYIKLENEGCYECFIGRDDVTGEIYDRTSYCKPTQKIIKKVAGCGTAFVPYGSTVSLKTACVCLDVIKRVFENRYHENVIVSVKGDDYHFKKEGLQATSRYFNQKSDTVECYGKQFMMQKCIICGELHDD